MPRRLTILALIAGAGILALVGEAFDLGRWELHAAIVIVMILVSLTDREYFGWTGPGPQLGQRKPGPHRSWLHP